MRTFFVPDEFWQSVEVSHRLVFGFGDLTWEWSKPYPVRSCIHMLLFAIPMYLLNIVGLDSPSMVFYTPLVLQSGIAVIGDYCMYHLTKRWFGENAAKWALILNLTLWSVVYCWSRTLINSAEAVVTLAVLLLLEGPKKGLAFFLMALSFAARPTSIIPWACWIFFKGIWTIPWSNLIYFGLVYGLPSILSCVLLDCFYYGRFTLTMWNFLSFNATSSSFFGVHPWYWYFANGIPTLAFSYLPLIVLGLWSSPLSKRYVVWCFVSVPIVVLSAIPHKEFRFLLPCLAVSIPFAGLCVSRNTFPKYVVLVMVLLNLPMCIYFCHVHQAGPMSVAAHMRAHPERFISVGYLAPCHSIPTHSKLHSRNISIQRLNCDPFGKNDSDEFFDDTERMTGPTLRNWNVSFIVAFEPLFETLERHGWKKRVEFFHAHFPSEERHGTKIAIWES